MKTNTVPYNLVFHFVQRTSLQNAMLKSISRSDRGFLLFLQDILELERVEKPRMHAYCDR